MYPVHMPEITEQFARCWHAAGTHLSRQVHGPMPWLNARLLPPLIEHLSFRLGNQLFFVRVEDADCELESPSSVEALREIAKECNGYPCVMPMKRHGQEWSPFGPGWGLFDIDIENWIDPPSLVTEENIEMTDWELQDFAVQIVRNQIEEEGFKLMSAHGCPTTNPSLWFVGDSGPEWVVVRAVRYPVERAQRPDNWDEIARYCGKLSDRGSFASVSVASSANLAGQLDATPLWRGHAMIVGYAGLERVHT